VRRAGARVQVQPLGDPLIHNGQAVPRHDVFGNGAEQPRSGDEEHGPNAELHDQTNPSRWIASLRHKANRFCKDDSYRHLVAAGKTPSSNSC
jgi:hypothetical protein